MTNALLNSFGLDFLVENEDTLTGFVAMALQKGKCINSYYDCTHFNYYFKITDRDNKPIADSLQIISNIKDEEGTKKLANFDVHDTGNKVWEFQILEECKDEEKKYAGQRQIVASKINNDNGLVVVNVMNPDILPSYLQGDKIKLQIKAIGLDVDYYHNEEEYRNSFDSTTTIVGVGQVISSQFMYNHQVVENNDREIDYSQNDLSILVGKVKKVYVKNVVLEDGNELTKYLNVVVETKYGDIDLIQSFSQIKDSNVIIEGAIVSAACVIQGDALIYEYENGMVLDFDNNLKALNFAMCSGEIDRLNSILSDDVHYLSSTTNTEFNSKSELLEYLKYVHDNQNSSVKKHIYNDNGVSCIKVDYDNLPSQIINIELNEDNLICKIVVNDYVDEVSIKSDGLDNSMQGVTLDLVYYWNIFENPKEIYCCDNFGCFETIIDGIPSIVIVRGQMIPNDPFLSDETKTMIPKIIDYIDEQILKGNKDYDIYFMGVRLTQTRVPKEEQSIFKIGGKYSGANSPIKLIRKCEEYDYGYSNENPFKMSKVSDEYYFFKNLKCNFGTIEEYYRNGSYNSGGKKNILDKWTIVVDKNRKYMYELYIDPYAFEVYEDAFIGNYELFGFTLDDKKYYGNEA